MFKNDIRVPSSPSGISVTFCEISINNILFLIYSIATSHTASEFRWTHLKQDVISLSANNILRTSISRGFRYRRPRRNSQFERQKDVKTRRPSNIIQQSPYNETHSHVQSMSIIIRCKDVLLMSSQWYCKFDAPWRGNMTLQGQCSLVGTLSHVLKTHLKDELTEHTHC